jgi:O-antigen/teichoic acid export membrane protein
VRCSEREAFPSGHLRRKIVRDTLWVGGGQVITALARLGALRVLTSLLATDVYGRMALLQGLSVLASTVFIFPFLQGVLRAYPDAARDDRIEALRGIGTRILWLSSAGAAIVLFGGGWAWSRYTGDPLTPLTLALLLAILLTEVVKLYETSLLGAARRQAVWSAWTACDAVARPLFAIAAIRLWGPTVDATFLGYAAGGAITNLAFRKWTVRGGDARVSFRSDPWAIRARREFVAFALPLVPMTVAAWVFNSSDRYVLGALHGDASVGEYAAAYAIGTMPFVLFAGIGTNAIRPVLFQAVADGDQGKERRTLVGWLGAFGLSSLVGAILLTMLAPFVARLALGPAFRGAQSLLPWIACAAAIQVSQQILETVLYAHRRTKAVVLVQAVAAAAAISFYLLLVPGMAARGGAIGTLLAAVVSTALTLVAVRARRSPTPAAA